MILAYSCSLLFICSLFALCRKKVIYHERAVKYAREIIGNIIKKATGGAGTKDKVVVKKIGPRKKSILYQFLRAHDPCKGMGATKKYCEQVVTQELNQAVVQLLGTYVATQHSRACACACIRIFEYDT